MNFRTLLSVLTILGIAETLRGQLTAEELWAAVREQNCERIAQELDSTPLINEQMKFHGAVCYYRNGNLSRALSLFQEVQTQNGQLAVISLFWESKVHAVNGQDNMAMSALQRLPDKWLNYKLITQPEFNELAIRNDTFAELRNSMRPRFNIWTSILAVIAVMGFITSIVLFFGKSRFSRGERWLAVVVFSFALILTAYLFVWTGYILYFQYLQSMWPFLTLLVAPSLFFYLKETFKEDYTKSQVFLHYSIPSASLLLTLPAILNDFGITLGLSQDLSNIGSSSTLLTGQLLYYAVRITSITSNEWQVDTNIKTWTKAISLGMWLYTLAFLSYFILVACSFFRPEWDYAISFMMALGIIGITYMGLIQKRIFSSEPIGVFLPGQKYQSSSLTPGASASIRTNLERILKEEQVFKENELRLDDLAAYLDISRHQLSQVINEHYGVNFFELINRYRIAYVKQVLANPNSNQQTIIQIAYEAGFNNKASFNRYFKQETGLTPSAYRIREHSLPVTDANRFMNSDKT